MGVRKYLLIDSARAQLFESVLPMAAAHRAGAVRRIRFAGCCLVEDGWPADHDLLARQFLTHRLTVAPNESAFA